MMRAFSMLVAAIFIGCFCCCNSLPVPTSKSILINADSVRFFASFIHSTATIDDLTIRFGTGTQYEELLRVPIGAPGELLPQTKIRITVGTNPPATDNDPAVGITDGNNTNQFYLIAHGSSTSGNPCGIINGNQNYRTAPPGNIVAGTYTMLFDPTHRFGSCSTNIGFAADGRFNAQVDPTKSLSLVVSRDDAQEQYTFHYFLVEFL